MMADLLRWNAFEELQRLAQAFDRLVDRSRSGSAWIDSPYASISSVHDGYRVSVPLPGIAPENVTVDVTGRSVHVRAIERDGDTEVQASRGGTDAAIPGSGEAAPDRDRDGGTEAAAQGCVRRERWAGRRGSARRRQNINS
jgi:hypothetical protein